MTRPLDLISSIISPLIFIMLAAGSVAAAEGELWEAGQESDPAVTGKVAPRPEEERQVETLEQKGGFIGYNFVITEGHGGNAQQYGFLHSSRSGGLFYRSMEKDSNLELEGSFLNENDYHGDLLLDYRGDYRLHLRTESLYHNLDRELLFTPNFQAGRTDARTPADYLAVQDAPQNYGISVVQDGADFRYRLHNYPLHVNLGYWRLVREGNIQQRFADASFEGTPNTVYATPRHIDQQTQEGRVGVDSHLGPVDLIYDFRVRVFKDSVATPVASYVARNDIHGNPESVGGLQQHNEDPDARLISNTVKLHTSLAGGIVGSGSYSIETRENLSRLSDSTGARHMKVHLENGAGDFVYTPTKEYSLALKYRRQEIDNDDRGVVLSRNFVNPLQLVKPPVDTTKDLVFANLSYRPASYLSFNGEYRGEFLKRSQVSAVPTTASWALPESTDTHTGTLSANYRPAKGLRLSADYSYSTVDHPSYGASYGQKHEGKLLATYTRSNSWGGSANLIVRREWNNEVEHFLVNFPLDPLSYTPYPLTSRERNVKNGNLAVWLVPFAKLTLGANYAYLENKVDQGVLFTSVVAGSEAASNFFNRSNVYGVNASYSHNDKLDLSLMLQQTRSISAFEPQPTVFSASSSTGGITDITRQHTVISVLSARGEYHFTPGLSSTLEYQLSDYNEKNPAYSESNGTVHTVFATVAAKW